MWTPTDKFLLSSLLPTEASGHRLRRLLDERRAQIDWEAVLERGRYHLLLPLIRYNLAQIDGLKQLPPAIIEGLQAEAGIWAAREMAYVNEARNLLVALQTHGIEAFPLKGVALMLGGYYPQAGLRPAQDIDLIVSPAQLDIADDLLESLGCVPLPGKRSLRARQRLANERNHLWPRRSPGGMVIELHHRAFQFTPRERDFGFAQMRENARIAEAGFLPLPSPADLALHLIHHTMVDMQSAQAILRTVVDLYFIFRKDPEAVEALRRRGEEFGFPGAIGLAEQSVNHLAAANLEALEVDAAHPELALLLETALMSSHSHLAEAARFLEYFNFSHQPWRKAGTIASLLFPTRAHLQQLYDAPQGGSAFPWQYLRRPLDLLRKIDWRSLRPANLRRLKKLRSAVLGIGEIKRKRR